MATTAKIAKEAKSPKYKVRLRNRCNRCGRPRAYLRKFALCRLCFRKLALDGDAEASQRTLQGHVHDHAAMGHAAMIGGQAPAVGGADDLNGLLYPPPALPYQPGRVREYTLRATDREIEIAPDVFFPAWTYNGTVPGPVIRATEGDLLRIRFRNEGTHPHSIHFHGIHAPRMDGVLDPVAPGDSFTYEFEARPYGMQAYHCHTSPLAQHMQRGLY